MEQKVYFAYLMNLQQNVDRTGRWLYEQIKRIHINRTIGCNCHYCFIDGDIDAGTKPGEETGKISRVQDEPARVGPDMGDVCPGQRWLFLYGG